MSKAGLLEDIGIVLKGKTSGSIKTLCPQCSEGRGKNKKDPCLSVDITEGVYNCHHCGWSGGVFEQKKKEYQKPLPRLEKLNKKALEWFEKIRQISNDTLLRLKITEAKEFMPQHGKELDSICFNYYRGEELVNIKFRGPEKSFKMAKDAELIFYNLNALEGQETVIIVEGEIDCLSLVESGIYNVVSVPNGASKGNQKLEYLDNCWQHFAPLKKIILAVDDDDAGRSLQSELARRLGKERCFTVSYPTGCKDANEVLCKLGREAIQEMISNAEEWPLEGLVVMDDMFDDITDWYENGYPKGAKSHIPGFDDLLRFAPGQMTVVTGIPGHGKDEVINLLSTSLSKHEGWKWGVCGFEEEPPITVTKLIEKYAGRSFAFRKNKESRITKAQFDNGIGFVDHHFFFINFLEVDTTVEGIIKKAKELVMRKGINGLIINPWNYIEHKVPHGYSETQYISEALTKLITFIKEFGIHCILVAHPAKMQKEKGKYVVPTLYNISGSAHFFNKTHNGICVYRDYAEEVTTIYVQKVKWSWLGSIGWSSYRYDTDLRQYFFLETSLQKKNEPTGNGQFPQTGNWSPLPIDFEE